MCQEINNFQPQVIYIDNQLNGLKGKDVAQYLKNRYNHIPIVLFATDLLPSDCPAADFIINYPFTKYEYQEVLQSFFTKKIIESYSNLKQKLPLKIANHRRTKI